MLNFKEIGNVTYKQIDIMKHTIDGREFLELVTGVTILDEET